MKEMSMKLSKCILPAVLIVLVAVLLCIACAEPADAATKYERGQLLSDSEQRTEIGGKYFYSEYSTDNETWTSYMSIYVSDTVDGTAKRIAKLNSDKAYLSSWILSNGSKVYYSYKDTQTGKYKIYRMDVNGKNKKLIKTMSESYLNKNYTQSSYGEYTLSLSSVYNNKLYCVWGNGYWGKGRLYSVSLKDGYKVTRRAGDFSPYAGYSSGGSRYLYGFSDSKQGLRVYDCKSDKIIRTISGRSIGTVGVKKGKLCYTELTDNGMKFYAASLSGKNKTLLLEIDFRNPGYFDPEHVYYMDDDWTKYRYDVATKEHVKLENLTEEELDKYFPAV